MAVDEHTEEEWAELEEAAAEPELPPQAADDSVLAALRAQRDELGEEHTYDVDVPGWKGLLVLRFGAISQAQQSALLSRIVASKGKQIQMHNLDLLIAAYRCGLGRSRPGGELRVIMDSDQDPASLKDLVEIVGLGEAPERAREAMRLLFQGANSPETSLTAVSNEWHEWATNENEEADRDFLGES
jgi:hypothetical protein